MMMMMNWALPIPDYIFPERARPVENFYGAEAEDFDELARRIQVTKDLVALSQLVTMTLVKRSPKSPCVSTRKP